MNRRGHRGRTDSNHAEIMQALRDAAIGAVSLAPLGDGIPDIATGFRGLTMFLEVKKSHSERLTAAEFKFHSEWPGHVAVVTTGEEAVIAVAMHAKAMGVI